MPEDSKKPVVTPPPKPKSSVASNGATSDNSPRSHHKKISQTAPVLPTKSVDKVVDEVINGDWGEGEEMRNKIRASGHSVIKIVAEVRRRAGEERVESDPDSKE